MDNVFISFLIACLTIWFIIFLVKRHKEGLDKKLTKARGQLIETMKAVKQTVENQQFLPPIKNGLLFNILTEAYVVNIFFDRDTKYAVIVPFINNKYISVPWCIEIEDGDFVWESDKITKEVTQKALKIYKQFKEENKSKFLKGE